jgi:hypothetical protein
VPDADDICEDEARQYECRRHLHVLRRQQQPSSIVAIGDDAADEREKQDRQLTEKRIEAEEERRRGTAMVSTSQFCATDCIQVPMVDVNAPNQSTRKSRYVSAAAIRRNPVACGSAGDDEGSAG